MIRAPQRNPNRRFLRAFILSALLNLTLLVLDFVAPLQTKTKYDYIHIAITVIRTVLFLILIIVSQILRARPISLSDLEGSDPAVPNVDRSRNFETFRSTSPRLSPGRVARWAWITYILSFKVSLQKKEC
jgi:hypothetical protein